MTWCARLPASSRALCALALAGIFAACTSAQNEPQVREAEAAEEQSDVAEELGADQGQTTELTLQASEEADALSDDEEHSSSEVVVSSQSSLAPDQPSTTSDASSMESAATNSPSGTSPSATAPTVGSTTTPTASTSGTSTSVVASSTMPSSTFPEASSGTPTSVMSTSSVATTSVPAAVSTSTTQPSTSESSTTSSVPASTPTQPETPDVDDVNETTQLLDDFESYGTGDSVPPTWFNYGNAGGGVSLVGVAETRVRTGQSGDNKLLAWGFDAVSDPGYGGVGKEYASPQNWSQYSGVRFWFYGSGEGGSLQIEIGEDKTSDVERYRGGAFTDNQVGWQIVRVPFDSFSPASWNPAPGNEVLDLVSVENIVFAVNSGATTAGVAIDDVSLYVDNSSSTTSTTVPQADTSPPTDLVWSDEFNGSGINTSNWRYDIGGWGWGNGESQYYTNRQENARVEDGALVIEAHREDYLGSSYTSARLLSQNLREFQYGRIEARVKVPAGTGTWPAFWMLGTGLGEPGRVWPDVGEIDILEYVGREPNVVIGALHGPGYSGGNAIDQWSYQSLAIADDWHVVAVEWNYSGITWFLDGVQFHSVSRNDPPGEWVFDQPFFIILNLAIGGTLGGTIDPNLEFPLRYYVDYVRVYQ